MTLLRRRRVVESDVCIIGSGISAAMVAEKLARTRAATIVVVEAGDDVPALARRPALRRRFLDYGENPWPKDHLDGYEMEGPLQSRSMCVGGLAMHWGGVTPRFSPEDFRLRSQFGVGTDWPISYEDLEPYYLEAEQLLGVAGEQGPPEMDPRSKPFPMPMLPLTYNLGLLKDWVTRAGITMWSQPSAKNSIPYGGRAQCCRNDTCTPICPIGAKYSPDFTWNALRRAKRVDLITRTLVRRLDVDEHNRVVRAVAVSRDASDTEVEFRAKHFVVAGGYVWSSHLLLSSRNARFENGIGNSSGLVGKYLTGHRNVQAFVRLPMKLYPGINEQHSLVSKQFMRVPPRSDGKYLRHDLRVWESGSGQTPRLRDESGALMLGDEILADWRKRTAHGVARVRAYYDVIPDRASELTLDDSRKNRWGDPLPKLAFRDAPESGELRGWTEDTIRVLFREMARAGGGEVQRTQSDAFQDHPAGGCRMGNDPATSVTDSWGRTHDHENLFVVGAPTCVSGSCANATLTFCALALRSAEQIGLVVFLLAAAARLEAQGVDWPAYGSDAGATKYSRAADVNRANVSQLRVAWEWSTGETPLPEKGVRPGNFQVTPLVINDTMYVSTSYNRVVALDANTGRQLWEYDPKAYEYGQVPNGTGFVHRGVAMWSEGKDRRILMNSRWRLIELDAATGKLVRTFGDSGVVDLVSDLSRPTNKLHYTQTSPPVVWKNLVIVGNGVADRLVYPGDPPGDVQAFDVRTGKRVWRWSGIPLAPSDEGAGTWENDSWKTTGHTNVWAPFSIDVERGLVYLPVSTASNDGYGGGRLGDNLFAESIVCLDAHTGKKVWHFQTVHHGLWDYDLPAPPVLGSVRVNGVRTDIVAVPTKTGFLFVFDRVTGKPVWPIEERAVPASDVPGERAAPTQPFPTKPKPFAKQGFSDDDLIDFTPELKARAHEVVSQYRMGQLYAPPSLQGTIAMPGLIGGAAWGGGAFDPSSGVIYVKSTSQPALLKVGPVQARTEEVNASYTLELGAAGNLNVRLAGGGGDSLPSLPINKPPYGTLTAIDLNSGEHLWQVTLGDSPAVRDHPSLRLLNLARLGVAGAPGPIVTGGGLLFASGGGSALYALDTRDGRVLWSHDIGQRAYSVPMTYRTSSGRQFVVIASGAATGGKLTAFALP